MDEDNKEYILKVGRSLECIIYLCNDIYNNKICRLMLKRYIECMGMDKVKRGIIEYTHKFGSNEEIEEIKKNNNIE